MLRQRFSQRSTAWKAKYKRFLSSDFNFNYVPTTRLRKRDQRDQRRPLLVWFRRIDFENAEILTRALPCLEDRDDGGTCLEGRQCRRIKSRAVPGDSRPETHGDSHGNATVKRRFSWIFNEALRGWAFLKARPTSSTKAHDKVARARFLFFRFFPDPSTE